MNNYEGTDKEVEQAVQMSLLEVALEDPRFTENGAALSEDFRICSRIFFLGKHVYGVAAQVFETTETMLSVTLTVNIFFISYFFWI